MADVEVLMNLDQFCRAQPRASIMYCDPNSYVKHGCMEVSVSAITGVVNPPNIILDWDPLTCTLQQICIQVWHQKVTNSMTISYGDFLLFRISAPTLNHTISRQKRKDYLWL